MRLLMTNSSKTPRLSHFLHNHWLIWKHSCSLSKCQYFYNSFELPPGIEFILIQCKGSHSNDAEKKNAKSVYVNAHAIVSKKPQMQKIFDNFKTLYPEKRPLSVLMLGIDSISRLNLIRALPNTAQVPTTTLFWMIWQLCLFPQHLYDSGWFELKGSYFNCWFLNGRVEKK